MANRDELSPLRFAVDTRPACIWTFDPPAHNLEFLSTIDPTYFEYVARAHLDDLNADKVDKKQAAALTVRMAYSHGLEALFAFLCATVQAPNCVYGWLTRYRTAELYSLVRKIHTGQPIYSLLKPPPTTWRRISDLVHAHYPNTDPAKREWIIDGYARTWERFADDFLNQTARNEYNSIKHGFRVSPGGFALSVGREEIPGVPCPPEKMTMLGSAEFGSTFFVLESLYDSSSNFRSVRHSRNWAPVGLVHGLLLISLSLRNIIGRLQVHSGKAPESVQIFHPDNPGVFDLPWRDTPGVFELSYGPTIPEAEFKPLTDDQILAVYPTKP